ncbi:MAG: hypothetical protein ACRDYE_02475 [Acidimicrobiales bacterium]
MLPVRTEVEALSRGAGRAHRIYWVVVLVVVLGFGVTVAYLESWSSGTTRNQMHRPTLAAYGAPPVLGVLGVTGRYLPRERESDITAVTISVSWAHAEPRPGSFSSSYLSSVDHRMSAALAADLKVVLDPGLQYPPGWVFSLPGGTRFVNQFGDVFTGTPNSGDDVANALTDPSVRHAEGVYLSWLGSHLPSGSLAAVREGGGPLGELRYPDPVFNGRTNSYWAYDSSTAPRLPASVQGWVPGTGTTRQAQIFLDAYNARLVGYGRWLNAMLHDDFHCEELVLLPGWGERTGGEATEVATRLTLPMDEFNEGLDWVDLLDSLPDPTHSVAYTTYLDAPSVEATLALEDPADYLAYLVEGTSIRLGGENTGNGTMADLRLSLHRARLLHFAIVQWMDEAQLVASTAGRDPAGPSFNLLRAAATS